MTTREQHTPPQTPIQKAQIIDNILISLGVPDDFLSRRTRLKALAELISSKGEECES